MQTQAPDVRGTAHGANPLRFSSRPDGHSGHGPPSHNGRELTAMGFLTAFRRKWVPAMALGVPAAMLVAALLWEFVPAKYESYALLKIQQHEQVQAFDSKEKQTEFLVYRDTQKGYIKTAGVLTAALRHPDVAGCRTLRNVPYPVDWLAKELTLDEASSPEFLRLGLSGEFPRDLALIVNAVKEAYMSEVVYNERNDRIRKLKGLEDSFEEMDNRVRAARANIDRLAENLGTSDPKVAILNQALIQQQLLDLQKDLREINGQIRAEEAVTKSLDERGLPAGSLNRNGLQGSDLSGTAPAASSAGNSSLTSLQRELLTIRQKIAQFQTQIRNPSHPDLRALQRQEEQLLILLTGGVAPQVTNAVSGVGPSRLDWLIRQRETLEKEIETQSAVLKDMGVKMVEMERENREIELEERIRDDLARQIQERKVELNASERITVAQDAMVPEQRETKKKTQYSLLAALATLGSIVLGFTLFEWFAHRVGAATDISSEVGLRLVGTIPSPDSGGLLGLGLFAGKVDYDEWNRAVTESMDVVRTFLMRHIDPSRPASILITSASANEGKTTVSCQLAASLARTGKRVALVDCDFRRPSAHLMIDGQQGPGLSEFLRGECTLDDIRQATQAPGLTFLGAGMVDQRVLKSLAIDGGRALMQQLKSQYDFVIIDTSPLLFVAEPSMIAQNADIVLLATRKDYSRVPYVVQARDSLRSLQIPLLGAIMVGADSDFQRQSYGYQQEVVRMVREG